ncbi:hypothetical protein KJ996_06130 [Patescibacteria group bacterium]|nr:hypothetical protein [Patescibacteria group bacterium]
MKPKYSVLICAGLILFLTGCEYYAGNFPEPRSDVTTLPDSTKVIVVDGKQRKCVYANGTWRCVELKTMEEMLTGGQPDASERSNKFVPQQNRPQSQNEGQ